MIRSGPAPSIGRSSMVNAPASGRTYPANMPASVLLPQPEMPMSTVSRPGSILNEQSSSTCTGGRAVWWYHLRKPTALILPDSFLCGIIAACACSFLPGHQFSFRVAHDERREITGKTDADHAYDHRGGGMTDVALPGQPAEPDVACDHFCGDHHVPAHGDSQCHAGGDGRDHGRQDDAAEDVAGRGTQGAREPQMLLAQAAHGIVHVDDDDEEGTDEGDENDRKL